MKFMACIPVGVDFELHWQHHFCSSSITSLNLSKVWAFDSQYGQAPRLIDRKLGLRRVHIFVLFEVRDQEVQ